MIRGRVVLAALAALCVTAAGARVPALRHESVAVIRLHALGHSMPKAVRLSPDGRLAVVPCMGSFTIAVLSATGYTQLGWVKSSARMPVECTITDDSATAFIQCLDPGIILELDLAAIRLTRTSAAHGRWPKVIEFAPDRKTLWVSDWIGQTVNVIDPVTLERLRRIGVERTPRGIGFLRTRPRAYIANFGEMRPEEGTVTVIDTNTCKVIRTLGNLKGAPRHVSVSPDDRWVYVTNMGLDLVHVIDTGRNAVVAAIPVGSRPKSSDLTSDGRFLYVANYGDGKAPGSVSVVDTRRRAVVATVPAGKGPTGLDVSPDDGFLWVTNIHDGTVEIHRIVRE